MKAKINFSILTIIHVYTHAKIACVNKRRRCTGMLRNDVYSKVPDSGPMGFVRRMSATVAI